MGVPLGGVGDTGVGLELAELDVLEAERLVVDAPLDFEVGDEDVVMAAVTSQY